MGIRIYAARSFRQNTASMKHFFPRSQFVLVAGLLFSVCLIAARAGGDDLNLQAKLIWGSNGSKPKNPNVKAVDGETADKLRGVFKWKDYYEVSRTNFAVAVGATKKVTMSRKCDVNVQNLGKFKVEVELFGEGKMLVQKRQAIKAGELLVLAGDDKNDTAWFVILTHHER